MDHQFWLDKWRANRIGFHRDDVHPFLTQHWPGLGLRANARVLAPLCGKAKDLIWLANAGHQVVGVELSEIAVAAFFAEHGLEPRVDQTGPFRRYSCWRIEILVGDFFSLSRKHAGSIAGVYDRAALIALAPGQRDAYVRKLHALTDPGAQTLLVTLQYPAAAINPPPFSVTDEQVLDLYRDRATVELLGERDDIVKGVSCREFAYRLARSSC